MQGDVEAISAERERLNVRLLETARSIKKSEAQLTTIEARLGELEAQEKLLKGSLSQRHGQIAKLLAALQRMGRNPPPVLITQREDALKMVRSAMLLAVGLPRARHAGACARRRLNELVRVMTDIRTRGRSPALRNDAPHRCPHASFRPLGGEEGTRSTERQSELKRMRTAGGRRSRKNVTDLNELIARLDQAVKDHTGLGAYDKEAPHRQAARRLPPRATRDGPHAPAPKAAAARKALKSPRCRRRQSRPSSSWHSGRLARQPGPHQAEPFRSSRPKRACLCPRRAAGF